MTLGGHVVVVVVVGSGLRREECVSCTDWVPIGFLVSVRGAKVMKVLMKS